MSAVLRGPDPSSAGVGFIFFTFMGVTPELFADLAHCTPNDVCADAPRVGGLPNERRRGKVRDYPSRNLGVEREIVTPTATFMDDLATAGTAWDVPDLVLSIEEAFGVEITDGEGRKDFGRWATSTP